MVLSLRDATSPMMESARISAVLHGYETDDADQMKRADRVDLASWGRRSTRRRRALMHELRALLGRLVTRVCAMTSAVVARPIYQMLLARMSPGQ
jgi:hypothetical protein